MRKIRIAIDGPAGAGKSSISKHIAKKLDIVYLDTGAMYRTVALKAINENVDVKNEEKLTPLLKDIKIKIKYIKGVMHIFLDNQDITNKIRTKELSIAASDIAIHPVVREKMVELQRQIAAKRSVVMDGRDIGSYVLKDADIKIFLTADVDDRAQRRYLELKEKGEEHDFDDIRNDISYRDKNDSSRKIAPLTRAGDAILFDTTGNTLNESKELLSEFIKEELEIKKYRLSRSVIQGISKLVINILYRIRIEGLENVPAEGSLIVCANHSSYADVPLLECYIKRLITFAAKKELYKLPLISYLVRTFDSIPVDRKTRDLSAAKELYKRLKRGRCVGIFPEGTRSIHIKKGEKKYRIRNGAVKLAFDTNTPILPVGIKSSFKLFSKVVMVVGKPVTITMNDDIKNPNDFFRTESKKLMDNIYALTGSKNEYINS